MEIEILKTAIASRLWRSEPDGPNDRSINIWWQNNWVPAFFSDLHKGDFFLDLKTNLAPDRCFYASSDSKRLVYKSVASFVVSGLEIVQKPVTEEQINQLGYAQPKLLGN